MTPPSAAQGASEQRPYRPVFMIVNAMVEEGFDPDGASYQHIAEFCLDALREAGYTLMRQMVDADEHYEFPEGECAHDGTMWPCTAATDSGPSQTLPGTEATP